MDEIQLAQNCSYGRRPLDPRECCPGPPGGVYFRPGEREAYLQRYPDCAHVAARFPEEAEYRVRLACQEQAAAQDIYADTVEGTNFLNANQQCRLDDLKVYPDTSNIPGNRIQDQVPAWVYFAAASIGVFGLTGAAFAYARKPKARKRKNDSSP